MRYLFFSDDDTAAGVTPPEQQPDGDCTHVQAIPANVDTTTDDTWWQEKVTAGADIGTAPLSEQRQVTDRSSESVITTPLGEPPARATGPLHEDQSDPSVSREQGLAFAVLRDIGQVRSVNQDSVYGMIVTVPRVEGDVPIGLFIVADGMGGHEGGEVASRLAVRAVAQVILADLIVPALDEAVTESLQMLLTTALQEANRAVWDMAQANGTDMGTTCTAALLIGHTVYVGHIGDSRAYLVTSDGLHSLTSDHSAVGRLIQMGQIDAEEAREHPLRSHLYRTVGQTPEVVVDYDYHQIGDATHLLLCSDGLWGMIDEADMHAAVQGSVRPEDACHKLIALANAAGGEDNISAVVVALP